MRPVNATLGERRSLSLCGDPRHFGSLVFSRKITRSRRRFLTKLHHAPVAFRLIVVKGTSLLCLPCPPSTPLPVSFWNRIPATCDPAVGTAADPLSGLAFNQAMGPFRSSARQGFLCKDQKRVARNQRDGLKTVLQIVGQRIGGTSSVMPTGLFGDSTGFDRAGADVRGAPACFRPISSAGRSVWACCSEMSPTYVQQKDRPTQRPAVRGVGQGCQPHAARRSSAAKRCPDGSQQPHQR
jgi:hypothetical protein